MLSKFLLPENANLTLENVHIDTEKITVTARANRNECLCPECGAISHRVHSRYRRTIADFAGGHRQVTHSIRVRRFFCDNNLCRRHTFVEKLDDFASPFARRSIRLAEQQQAVGLAVGGETSATLLTMPAMPVSGDTIR